MQYTNFCINANISLAKLFTVDWQQWKQIFNKYNMVCWPITPFQGLVFAIAVHWQIWQKAPHHFKDLCSWKSEIMFWSKTFVLTFAFHADGEDAEAPLCRNPSCSRTCWPKEDGGYFNYCGITCAKSYRNLSRSQASSTPGVFSGYKITELNQMLGVVHTKYYMFTPNHMQLLYALFLNASFHKTGKGGTRLLPTKVSSNYT